MSDYFPCVIQAVAGEEKNVYAYFSDGTVRRLNMEPVIRRGGVFKRLEDERFFRERLTVLNDTVAWDLSGRCDPADCIDIDPFTAYEAPVVSDPLGDHPFTCR
ncbi:MAG: DUF2442 domain-containing protein [Oscillospiraceae bacterium]|nr:DUF2442 domain-containing protein [Oscillospiraceae bacterium]